MLRVLVLLSFLSVVSGLLTAVQPLVMEWTNFPNTKPTCSVLGHWQHLATPNRTLVVSEESVAPTSYLHFEYESGARYSGYAEALPDTKQYQLYLQSNNKTKSDVFMVAGCYGQELWVLVLPQQEESITTFIMTPKVEEKAPPVVSPPYREPTAMTQSMDVEQEVDDDNMCYISWMDRTIKISGETLGEALMPTMEWGIRYSEPNESFPFQGKLICYDQDPVWLIKFNTEPETEEEKHPQEPDISDNRETTSVRQPDAVSKPETPDGDGDDDICYISWMDRTIKISRETLREALMPTLEWGIRYSEPEESFPFQGKLICSGDKLVWLIKL